MLFFVLALLSSGSGLWQDFPEKDFCSNFSEKIYNIGLMCSVSDISKSEKLKFETIAISPQIVVQFDNPTIEDLLTLTTMQEAELVINSSRWKTEVGSTVPCVKDLGEIDLTGKWKTRRSCKAHLVVSIFGFSKGKTHSLVYFNFILSKPKKCRNWTSLLTRTIYIIDNDTLEIIKKFNHLSPDFGAHP